VLELSQNIVIGTTYVVNSISQSVTILFILTTLAVKYWY